MLANRYTYPYHPNGSLYLLADTMLKQLVFDKPRVFVVPPLVLAALVLHQDAEHCVQQWPRKYNDVARLFRTKNHTISRFVFS